ncbi:NUDIX domain-containing protein [Streptomyces sp. NPDC054849]
MTSIPASVPRTGGCLCRTIQFTVTGPPDYPHTCSCGHCQGLSGGPMMSWVSFPLDGLTWHGGGGEPSWHHTWPDSKRGFCPRCGSQLCALDDGATSIAITLSALGNPPDLVPVNQSCRDTAVSWLPPLPDTRHHPRPHAQPHACRESAFAGPPPRHHAESGDARHTVPVDVHLILRRDGESGPEVLLSRRAGPVYASGLWHLPSGHLDPGEDMVEAVIREAREETGVLIDTEHVTAAVTVHHRPPTGTGSRIGVFFEVRQWSGKPHVREPDRCDGMDWYPLDTLPDPIVAYCRAGLDAYRAGLPAAVHFQHPDDRIRFAAGDPGRTRLLPAPPAGARSFRTDYGCSPGSP